mmetsp:Transcript_61403/g.155097  ORF Transcript_61403/g.155097 Transcript_61403/m.155097 type:complete len:131 (+) Transcript_61403:62-454(+)
MPTGLPMLDTMMQSQPSITSPPRSPVRSYYALEPEVAGWTLGSKFVDWTPGMLDSPSSAPSGLILDTEADVEAALLVSPLARRVAGGAVSKGGLLVASLDDYVASQEVSPIVVDMKKLEDDYRMYKQDAQ